MRLNHQWQQAPLLYALHYFIVLLTFQKFKLFGAKATYIVFKKKLDVQNLQLRARKY